MQNILKQTMKKLISLISSCYLSVCSSSSQGIAGFHSAKLCISTGQLVRLTSAMGTQTSCQHTQGSFGTGLLSVSCQGSGWVMPRESISIVRLRGHVWWAMVWMRGAIF